MFEKKAVSINEEKNGFSNLWSNILYKSCYYKKNSSKNYYNIPSVIFMRRWSLKQQLQLI